MKNGSVRDKIKFNCSVLESGGNRFNNSSVCAHFKITFLYSRYFCQHLCVKCLTELLVPV